MKEGAEEAQTSPLEAKIQQVSIKDPVERRPRSKDKKERQKKRKRVHRNPPRCREEPKDVSNYRYDQLSKDVKMFVSDEEVGHTFAYWYKRYGLVIRDSVLPDSKKRDLILMKLDEDAYRKCGCHTIETTARNRFRDRRINCPPLTANYVPFRDYANMVKRVDEDARLKELDYTALKTLQFVAGIQDPSLREVRLRMIRRLDTHTEDTPLTIEDLVAKCENFTALKMDNTDMEGSHDVHVVQKKKVKCFNCG
ncbi:hypothetical protein RB195_022534 [Necator americanus]|uniref:DUF7083 domain-containing protein n=1 Tax=Necator americanus TaxID=51031 RepID=A0ABR1EFP3_NECAM